MNVQEEVINVNLDPEKVSSLKFSEKNDLNYVLLDRWILPVFGKLWDQVGKKWRHLTSHRDHRRPRWKRRPQPRPAGDHRGAAHQAQDARIPHQVIIPYPVTVIILFPVPGIWSSALFHPRLSRPPASWTSVSGASETPSIVRLPSASPSSVWSHSASR